MGRCCEVAEVDVAFCEVVGVRYVSSNTVVLRVENPFELVRAGQLFNLGIPEFDVNREYSIYSGANDECLEFLVRIVDGGICSPKISELKPGDEVEVDGPYGDFCLPRDLDLNQKFLFLATGTGIAPFHSFCRTFTLSNYKILHGIRFCEETYERDHYLDGSYTPCISAPRSGGKPIRITGLLEENPSFSEGAIIYLCGNRKMIIDAYEILRRQSVPADRIVTEVFF
jgi:ferredoxin--NADP+ reductase